MTSLVESLTIGIGQAAFQRRLYNIIAWIIVRGACTAKIIVVKFFGIEVIIVIAASISTFPKRSKFRFTLSVGSAGKTTAVLPAFPSRIPEVCDAILIRCALFALLVITLRSLPRC